MRVFKYTTKEGYHHTIVGVDEHEVSHELKEAHKQGADGIQDAETKEVVKFLFCKKNKNIQLFDFHHLPKHTQRSIYEQNKEEYCGLHDFLDCVYANQWHFEENGTLHNCL